MLRPYPEEDRDLEKFRRYTESWKRPAADEDSAEFNVWKTDEGPPSHSVPPHRVAKAAAEIKEIFTPRKHRITATIMGMTMATTTTTRVSGGSISFRPITK